MSIGTSLFSEMATRGFTRLNTSISALQTEISSGKNNPRPSADQMRAAQLSALKEQNAAISHFSAAAEQAASRVALSDQAIGDIAVIMRELQELALQSASDTLPDEGLRGLLAEAMTLRDALVETANRVDALGQPLFSGYAASPAFVDTADGVVYMGDGGRPSQRLSETLTLPVGLNGADLFQGIESDGQKLDLFKVVDDVIASFGDSVHAAKPVATAQGLATLRLNATREPQVLDFTLTGPAGSVDLSATLVSGLPGEVIDAINAQTVATGITATLSADGAGIELSAAGEISISNMARDDNPRTVIGTLTQEAYNGSPAGTPQGLRTEAMSQDSMVGFLSDAISHFAAKRSEVGAMGATVDRQSEALDVRQLRIDEAIAGLEDLDVAAAVTKLQTLLLTRDASQQTFVKITQTNLFDYLR